MSTSATSVAHNIQGKSRTGDVLISENVDFSGLLLSDKVLSGLQKAGFQRPSPIQLKAIPLGRCGLDLIVQAKSGTGKTCVFSVIALEGIQTESYALQVLVLAPTREIAIQIWDVISSIGQCIPSLKCHTFIGGMPLTEDKQKLKKCHIAVGTPGRMKQLIESNIMKTDSVRMFVLDEADKLLEESFQEQINWIYSTLPENKQMLALSATYPEYLAQHLTGYMRNPTFLRLNVTDPALLGIKQFKKVVDHHALPNRVFDNKTKVVIELLSSVNFQQCLIFSNLQTRAQNMADALIGHGWPTACIAGSHDQKDRNEAMSQLKMYKCRVLISTDLTSRGIDADKVNMVINLDVPKDHETYLHRIGRAGRFGSFGAAVTIVSHGQEEKDLSKVEKKCNTLIQDLPDPIPSTLAKSEGTVCLDDMVSTEQIMTDHARIPPKKNEFPKHKQISNHTAEFTPQNGMTMENLKTVKPDLDKYIENKGKDQRTHLSSNYNKQVTQSDDGKSSVKSLKESFNDSQTFSPNECGDNRNIDSQLCSAQCQEKSEDHFTDFGRSLNRKMEKDTEEKGAVIPKLPDHKGQILRKMKKKSCPLKFQIPQLDEGRSQNVSEKPKSFKEKEEEYRKFREKNNATLIREEIKVKPIPFKWKEGEKDHLLSMIDKILSLDDRFDEDTEKKSKERSVKCVNVQVQTDALDVQESMQGDNEMNTQTQEKQNGYKHKSTSHKQITDSEFLVPRRRERFSESDSNFCYVEDLGSVDNIEGSLGHGRSMLYNCDRFHDKLLQEENENEAEFAEEETFYEYPYYPQANFPHENYPWTNYPQTNYPHESDPHFTGQLLPHPYYPRFNHAGPPWSEMSRIQRKYLFNYQISQAMYQQQQYISAMLGQYY
uniref:RNA helicase n=1 Tax=Crassostrea virginica TaxID=6565 RepID=A0A8B8B0K9_CRAVI|nr:probable ATP-dependent RNA helicase DDX20 [Crassostrea virginica]